MPEVIDLISSSSPVRRVSRVPSPTPESKPSTSRLLQPPSSSAPNAISSDNFDISIFDYGDYDKPPKRRRLSEELGIPNQPTPITTTTTTTTKSSLQYSDDDFTVPLERLPTVKTYKWNGEESDPIVFTSSAPQPSHKASAARQKSARNGDPFITIDDSDNGLDEEHGDNIGDDDEYNIFEDKKLGNEDRDLLSDPFALPDLDELLSVAENRRKKDDTISKTTSKSLSSRTAKLLEGLDSRPKTEPSNSRPRKKSASVSRAHDQDPLSDDLLPEPPQPKPRRATKLTASEKEAKARERETVKLQREREKQLEKERKQKLKEEKAREKQLAADLSEVNKLKTDKKISTPEMIVDVASELQDSSVGNQLVEIMKRVGAELSFVSSNVPNVIKWRRKVVAKFNETAGHWEPCPHHIVNEEHILCLVPAQDFVDMVLAATSDSNDDSSHCDSLELHVLKIKSAYPGYKPIYLIEGLTAWMRKNQNSRNRAYQAAVRRQMSEQQLAADGATSSQPGRQSRKRADKKPETTPPVDDDTIEDALLQLQVQHACLIHHTAAAPESADWIKNFTEHISTIPYRREKIEGNDSAFCMDNGQVRPGEDKLDTFVKMLQEVNRVTASMAYGIAARYPSVLDLVRSMRLRGPLMLEDVKKSANKNGALTDARVGPAASKRLYKVFMGLDPSSTDI